MKRYIIDQAVLLVVGIVIMICIPFFCSSVFTIILEVIAALSWGYLCRRILVFPLDLLLKRKTKEVFWGAKVGIEDFEFSELHCCLWKFYYGSDKTLVLLVPVAAALEKANAVKHPNKDQKVRVSYYRFSKILYYWEVV